MQLQSLTLFFRHEHQTPASRLCTHRRRPRDPRAAPGATNRLGSVVIEALVGGRGRRVTRWTARARCWQTARRVSRKVWTLQIRMEEGGIVARGKFRPWWKVSPVSDQRHLDIGDRGCFICDSSQSLDGLAPNQMVLAKDKMRNGNGEEWIMTEQERQSLWLTSKP